MGNLTACLVSAFARAATIFKMGKRKLEVHEEPASDLGTEEVHDDESEQDEDAEDEDSSEGEDEGTDESEASEDEQPDSDGEDEVNVDLEFFDPAERDFHGMKALLQHYLDDEPFDSSSMVDTLIQQNTVGTVVKTSEEDDPIAVTSVLNTQRYSNANFMKQILNYLVAHSKDSSMKDQIKAAWASSGTGLLVNERLINCPPKLAPPLLQALLEEVTWATEDEPTAEKRDSFKFTRYILCTRVYADVTSDAPPPKKKQGKPSDATDHSKTIEPSIVYIRPEDEFLHKYSSVSHSFRIETKAVGRDELLPMRLIMVVDSKHMETVQNKLDQVIGNMALTGNA